MQGDKIVGHRALGAIPRRSIRSRSHSVPRRLSSGVSSTTFGGGPVSTGLGWAFGFDSTFPLDLAFALPLTFLILAALDLYLLAFWAFLGVCFFVGLVRGFAFERLGRGLFAPRLALVGILFARDFTPLVRDLIRAAILAYAGARALVKIGNPIYINTGASQLTGWINYDMGL